MIEERSDTMDVNETWRTDWTAFVRAVAKLHSIGRTDSEISTVLTGSVRWLGQILEIKLDAQYSRAIFDMSEVKVPLQHGETCWSSYAFVSVDITDLEFWRWCKPGDHVCFEATLGRSGPFEAIRVSGAGAEKARVLMVRLHHGRRISRKTHAESGIFASARLPGV